MASQTRRNSILEGLGAEGFGKISRELETVTLLKDDVVVPEGEKNAYLYFPTSAVISFLGETGQGGSIEVWSVGREGAAGVSGILGREAPFSGVVQISGHALRAKTSMLREHFERSRAFRRAIGGYLHYLLTQTSCLGICNNIHPLVQRFSRWLLVMERRVGKRSLNFTHDGIAALLGTRRATISVAAAELQASGAISYTPGAITIASRRKLARSACGCHKAINSEFR
jgi:CRP-like cAMP-binding protein